MDFREEGRSGSSQIQIHCFNVHLPHLREKEHHHTGSWQPPLRLVGATVLPHSTWRGVGLFRHWTSLTTSMEPWHRGRWNERIERSFVTVVVSRSVDTDCDRGTPRFLQVQHPEVPVTGILSWYLKIVFSGNYLSNIYIYMHVFIRMYDYSNRYAVCCYIPN